MKRKQTQSLRGVGGWVGRDEKKDTNKRKRMLKCGVGVGKRKKEKTIKNGCNWEVRLGRREVRWERREGIREDSLRM